MRVAKLETLYRRAHLINWALTLSTPCAMQTADMPVIATLFTGDVLDHELDKMIATLFVLAMLVLIASFVFPLPGILSPLADYRGGD